jgi:hypothetical protein
LSSLPQFLGLQQIRLELWEQWHFEFPSPRYAPSSDCEQ